MGHSLIFVIDSGPSHIFMGNCLSSSETGERPFLQKRFQLSSGMILFTRINCSVEFQTGAFHGKASAHKKERCHRT